MKKQMTEKLNTNKGITLIALVITIIVMLILVAVTISMAVNGGLFEYAGRATSETKGAIANEQEFANLEANMTVEQLIDKYTGEVNSEEPPVLSIGDYVNYPVEYTNVSTHNNEEGEPVYPKDEFTGWRVLSKETDENGNILYVKLISAGIPLNYVFYNNVEGNLGDRSFLKTEIKSTKTNDYFYQCGFENVIGTTLEGTFENDYTDKVHGLSKTELDKAVCDLGGSVTESGTPVNNPEYKNLFAIPCKGEESTIYASTILGTQPEQWFAWCISGDGAVSVSRHNGVRVVVCLKPGVQFTPATNKINGTVTWDITI